MSPLQIAPFDVTARRRDQPLGTVVFNDLFSGVPGRAPDGSRLPVAASMDPGER
jgi:hypothetical protein